MPTEILDSDFHPTRRGEWASQAMFVARAKASRPEAWKYVERLKLACALIVAFPHGMAANDASGR